MPAGRATPPTSLPPRAVVFDLDGTLIDSRRDIAAAANYMLTRHGKPELPEERIVSYVGDGARFLVARSANLSVDDPEVEPLLRTFIDYYTAHAADCTTLMPGAETALRRLASMPLALCTNKPRRTTDETLARLDLSRWFACVVADGDLPKNKPDPLALLQIAQRLGVSPAELVMVGDGPQDIECGRAAGARTVGVRGGIGSMEQLIAAQPDILLDSLEELPDLVQSWTQSWAGNKSFG